MKWLLAQLNPKNWLRKPKDESLSPQSGAKLFFFELIKLALFAVVTIFLVRYFLFKPFYVKGASMEPSFFDREYLIIDEISYRFYEPQRGDTVVFRYPVNRKEYFLKRIIGLPGERIKIKDGQIIVYNQENLEGMVLSESYLLPATINRPDMIVDLKADEYFLLGDNRNSSFDSRFFGAVKEADLVGRVWLRGWPFNRAKIFSTINY
jgi:signal peptidase I